MQGKKKCGAPTFLFGRQHFRSYKRVKRTHCLGPGGRKLEIRERCRISEREPGCKSRACVVVHFGAESLCESGGNRRGFGLEVSKIDLKLKRKERRSDKQMSSINGKNPLLVLFTLNSFKVVENRTQLSISLGFTLAHGQNQASYVITRKGTCPNLVGT